MDISVFELFKIGIGPSSSHTMGPMVAAKEFLDELDSFQKLENITKLQIILHGSLALTGIGHATDKAILLGLMGKQPKSTDTSKTEEYVDKIKNEQKINLLEKHQINFFYHKDLELNGKLLPEHPNGMIFIAYNQKNQEIAKQIYFSVGGGFITKKEDMNKKHRDTAKTVPYPFSTGDQLLNICKTENKSITEVMLANEEMWGSKEVMEKNTQDIWTAMQESVKNGCKNKGILPGGLNVERRSYNIHQKLLKSEKKGINENFDWISLYALAVNEENAAGGRIVTAPTNGASGIIPAVMHYYEKYYKKFDIDSLINFFMTAGAIGLLYKENASISGAEMGCQGEVGVACSMAAGGLTALMGGNASQIEISAEIGMEHNLGLTCDPVKGLVQVPCIERNTMGAIKAVNASRLAMNGNSTPIVSLDKVILTMKQIGDDMQDRYKETSTGGLAINVIGC